MAMNLKNISWNSQPWDREVLISYFLQPSTGGQVLNKGRGAGFPEAGHYVWTVPLQQTNQQEAKVKVKDFIFNKIF